MNTVIQDQKFHLEVKLEEMRYRSRISESHLMEMEQIISEQKRKSKKRLPPNFDKFVKAIKCV